jgi:hypothetical protein
MRNPIHCRTTNKFLTQFHLAIASLPISDGGAGFRNPSQIAIPHLILPLMICSIIFSTGGVTLPLNPSKSNLITIHPPSSFTTNTLQLWLKNDTEQFQLFHPYLNALTQFHSFKSESALLFYFPTQRSLLIRIPQISTYVQIRPL